MEIYVIIGIIVAIVGYFATTYNVLVKKRAMTEEGWSGIEIQLKTRANLIPNLVETVQGYATHENAVFTKVTEMRSRSMGASSIAEKGIAEGMLSGALANLFAVAENYPELKASENFKDLQKQLSELEDKIQVSRRYYNATARDLNIKIESFPSNVVANTCNFNRAEYFEIEDPDEREVPEVNFDR